MQQAGVYLAIFVWFLWIDSMHSTGQGGGERKHVLALRKHAEHQQLSLPAAGQKHFLPIISESPKMSLEMDWCFFLGRMYVVICFGCTPEITVL